MVVSTTDVLDTETRTASRMEQPKPDGSNLFSVEKAEPKIVDDVEQTLNGPRLLCHISRDASIKFFAQTCWCCSAVYTLASVRNYL